MNPAFWDSSSLARFCIQQQQSAALKQLLRQYEVAVWWATPVEIRSAFERLLRTGELTVAEHKVAGVRLKKLRRQWSELQPNEALRAQAETFLMQYPLKAADALQLAAAWSWCSGDPHHCVFISGDVQLLSAAGKVGFEVVATY